jgi:hypothetical protein
MEFVVFISFRNYNPNRIIKAGSQVDVAILRDDVGNTYQGIRATNEIGLTNSIDDQIPAGMARPVRSDQPGWDVLVFERPVPGASTVTLSLDASQYGGVGRIEVQVPRETWSIEAQQRQAREAEQRRAEERKEKDKARVAQGRQVLLDAPDNPQGDAAFKQALASLPRIEDRDQLLLQVAEFYYKSDTVSSPRRERRAAACLTSFASPNGWDAERIKLVPDKYAVTLAKAIRAEARKTGRIVIADKEVQDGFSLNGACLGLLGRMGSRAMDAVPTLRELLQSLSPSSSLAGTVRVTIRDITGNE